MTTDTNGKWLGYGLGDTDPDVARTDPNWHAVTLIRQKLHDKYQWARALGVTAGSAFDAPTQAAVTEFQKRVGLPQTGIANFATRVRLGSYPPPAPPTHAMLTVRGTGGIIGLDYTSQIAQASPTHHEVPIDYIASMGGLPVGAANDPSAPSGNDAGEQAREMLTQWVLSTTASFSLSAYSLGTKGALLFLNDLFDSSHPLYPHRTRLVCVVFIADPWRPYGHTFYLGPIPSGQGIGAPYFTLSQAAMDALGWRVCWLANDSDLYTNAPLGGTGQVLADIEQIVLDTAVSDPLGTIQRAIPYLLQLLQKDAGINSLFDGVAGGLLTSLAGGQLALTAGLVGLLLPVLEGGFQGLIAGISGNGSNLPAGVAADVQAAILALKFFGSGTAPHLSYQNTAWSPNGPQTYLELGIQHANDWGARTPVLT